jgi:predicted ATPase/DNA-binding SARP family transcriptional activator
VRIQLLGEVAVHDGDRTLAGNALGGRRARIVLAALALAEAPMSPDRLAGAIWGDNLPPTWPVAIRGVIRGLRAALRDHLGADDVIQTVPAGYRLRSGIAVDVTDTAAILLRATDLAAHGRPAAALDLAAPLSVASGEDLLAGESGGWLDAHRADIDRTALDAADVAARAAGDAGDHRRAAAIAQRVLDRAPLDERGHRLLIRALAEDGDRAGAVRAYERCRTLLAEELGIDPSPETVGVYLGMLRDQPAGSPARLPAPRTPFFGRARERETLAGELGRPGLVTVTGRGGVGKSRLAIESASARQGFPGGRFWIPLGSLAADELVAATVALRLGVPVGVEDATQSVVGHLAALGRALLVLDGCEESIDGVASLTAALLAGCPELTVLATCRLPLGVAGERVLTAEPLPSPGGPGSLTPDDLVADPQVAILAARMAAAGVSLDLDASTAPLVAALCRRCGGLPLALELAGAQLSVMPIGDLLDELADVAGAEQDRLRTLARGSYAQLDPDEATVFRRFGVLDGPVPLSVVRAVVSGEDIPAVRVVRILRELSDRGLVGVEKDGPRWRYHQDDDLHRLARELLVDKDGERAAYHRLADAVRALLPDDPRDPPAPFTDEISAMLDSIRSLFTAGLDGRADAERCLELAFRLHRYWAATTVAEGRFWLSRLLSGAPVTSGDPAAENGWRRYATYALGYLGYWAGDTTAALDHLQAAASMFGDQPDPYVARALIYAAGLLDDLDRPAEALDCIHRAIAVAEPFGVDLRVAASMGVGSVLSERGDPAAADYAAQAIELCRDGGSAEQRAAALPTAAFICWQVGALDRAREFVDEAWPMHQQSRRIARVVLLSTAAGIALADGDVDGAIDLGRTADAEGTELGVEREVPLIRAVLARSLSARGDIGAGASVAGRAMQVALSMEFRYPLAIALESAALVLARAAEVDSDRLGAARFDSGGFGAGPADRELLVTLLDTAAALRTRGDRPAPATLRAEVGRLRELLGVGLIGAAVDPEIAAARAIAALELVPGP